MRIAGLLSIGGLLFGAALDDATRQLSRDIFQELIEINTTDSVGNTTRAADAMAKRLKDAGFPAADVQVLGPNDRKGNMVARLRGAGGKKPVLIIGHLDVVEARREDWTTDPFQFVEKDGYFYGRGTQDMKVDDAILVTTFIRFRREGYRPDRDLILALTADEEGGKSNGVDWLLKNHRDLIDAAFVLNADAGGVTTMNGKAVNVDVEASEKQYADFELTSLNPGGHSSLPTPDNAIYHLADALSRLEHAPFPVELNAVTRTYFERRAPLENAQTRSDMNAVLHTPPDAAAVARLSSDPRYNSMLRTTCVATRLSAGHANNALPQTAQAIVNCRILPGHSPAETEQALVRVFGDPKVTVRYVGAIGAADRVSDQAADSKGFPTVLPSPEVLLPLERVAAEMWPGAPVIPEMETGASDSIYTMAAGIPSYGINGVGIDQDDIRAHGKDERVRVTSFFDGVDFYYRFLKAMTAGK
ncbi:MAG: M20/M25/M40 family metallo-hydrolase [Bryobacteraceae bacterium]|jgi:acetylornithine deacetylase/succinyl-diaminopimelate desuccinylase-like protein